MVSPAAAEAIGAKLARRWPAMSLEEVLAEMAGPRSPVRTDAAVGEAFARGFRAARGKVARPS